MGLQVSNVNVKTQDGDDLTSFWIRITVKMQEKPTTSIVLNLDAFRSEADLDAGYSSLQLEDTNQGLATDVPRYLGRISDSITAGQYASLDMTTITNQIRDLLIEGDAHARWDELVGAEQVWAGFGVGNVVTEMP